MTQHIPINIELLLDYEPEELALEILAYMKSGYSSAVEQGTISLGYIIPELLAEGLHGGVLDRETREKCQRAIVEAWGWLEANSLLVWSDPSNGTNGFRRLTRRAENLTPEELKLFQNAVKLAPDNLHPRIRKRVWSNFLRGEFAVAVFYAAREVEISVKDRSNIEDIGVSLIRAAFHPQTGPLSDKSVKKGEMQARSDLFAGFLGSYKNPGSHRDVNLEDPIEAMQVVLFASHLLSIIDECQ